MEAKYLEQLCQKKKELIVIFEGRAEGRTILTEITKLICYYGSFLKIPDYIWQYILGMVGNPSGMKCLWFDILSKAPDNHFYSLCKGIKNE